MSCLFPDVQGGGGFGGASLLGKVIVEIGDDAPGERVVGSKFSVLMQ